MNDDKIWNDKPAGGTLPRRAITVLRGSEEASGGREIFNIATIERVAERLFGTNGDRPMLGRLRYLRTIDFPSPVTKGRGIRAQLGLDDLMQIVFVLELMHAGMSPNRAVRVMRTDWKTIKTAIAYGWARKNALGVGNRPFRSLVIAPSILSDLGSEDRANDALHEVVGVLTTDDFTGRQESGELPRRMLMIDTQAFVTELENVGDPLLGISRKEFSAEMELFCAEAFATTTAKRWVLGPPGLGSKQPRSLEQPSQD